MRWCMNKLASYWPSNLLPWRYTNALCFVLLLNPTKTCFFQSNFLSPFISKATFHCTCRCYHWNARKFLTSFIFSFFFMPWIELKQWQFVKLTKQVQYTYIWFQSSDLLNCFIVMFVFQVLSYHASAQQAEVDKIMVTANMHIANEQLHAWHRWPFLISEMATWM